VHWRWINTSIGSHPLHLHGFYFKVDSRGNGLTDNASDQSDREVTELMEPGSTFTMTWHADRPGNWLFHCHLAYHIIGHMPIEAMLRGKSTMSDIQYENGYVRHAGMGGLVLAFRVHGSLRTQPADPPPIARHVTLIVEPGPDDRADAPSFRYILAGEPLAGQQDAIGPPLIMTRGVTTAVDVTNLLREPTAVHWHGVELADSFYDGVAGYSGWGARRAPMIDPGQTFEAVITPPRAGTFIYHTHMDDVWQLRGGLAGPLIVLEPGARFDPSSDHVFTITTTHAWKDALKIFVNGTSSPPAVTCRVGVLQRLRFINMSTFWTNAIVSLSSAGHTIKWNALQVDGAYVAPNHRNAQSAVQYVTIGETRDFTFMPEQTGDLELQFWPDPTVPNVVTVPIHVVK
jgi:FtsP/CotA-like multicopper oxidase with cupredoxin domain